MKYWRPKKQTSLYLPPRLGTQYTFSVPGGYCL